MVNSRKIYRSQRVIPGKFVKRCQLVTKVVSGCKVGLCSVRIVEIKRVEIKLSKRLHLFARLDRLLAGVTAGHHKTICKQVIPVACYLIVRNTHEYRIDFSLSQLTQGGRKFGANFHDGGIPICDTLDNGFDIVTQHDVHTGRAGIDTQLQQALLNRGHHFVHNLRYYAGDN